jgi:ribosomal protein S18 acetylase RimI-like enzyme
VYTKGEGRRTKEEESTIPLVDLRSLGNETFATIHAAFAEAFSDYIVPLSPTLDGLREMLTRRGWVPELSVGVYDGETLVAFTLNGFDGTTGYDSGTGVLPSHRRAGLARQTMEWSRTRLRDAGAMRYVLEVLEANAPAAALYRDCGFDVIRRLQCWTYDSDSHSGTVTTASHGTIKPEWCDVEPAWQNTTASLQRARDPNEVLGDAYGYAVVFPSNGDVPQLAVDPAHRRQHRGRSLLDAARAVAARPLQIMNVDSRNEDIAAFLDACGAKRTVAQLEMACSLG